ncbi:MAG: menaquinone biosynthetic enzyme MqnA/MqnD family protein [Calditrichaceae bacterium]
MCFSSGFQVKSVMLFFKAELMNIKTIALDTSSRTSVALLKILLNEKYQISPEFIVMQPDLPEMLKRADAALIIGDKALHYQDEYPLFLDLGEEWFDMTGLPFVYAFWAGQDFALNSADVAAIIRSKEIGLQNIDEISMEFAKSNPKDWRFYRDYLTNNILYSFGEKEKEGLNEFYHYAFYLGLIEHIPELHFYER